MYFNSIHRELISSTSTTENNDPSQAKILIFTCLWRYIINCQNLPFPQFSCIDFWLEELRLISIELYWRDCTTPIPLELPSLFPEFLSSWNKDSIKLQSLLDPLSMILDCWKSQNWLSVPSDLLNLHEAELSRQEEKFLPLINLLPSHPLELTPFSSEDESLLELQLNTSVFPVLLKANPGIFNLNIYFPQTTNHLQGT